MTPTHKNRLNRRSLLKGAAASTVGILAAPMVARAESKSIKIGMTTILSGRVAQLAGLRLRDRWAGWNREPFTTDSRSHVSVWEKPLQHPDA